MFFTGKVLPNQIFTIRVLLKELHDKYSVFLKYTILRGERVAGSPSETHSNSSPYHDDVRRTLSLTDCLFLGLPTVPNWPLGSLHLCVCVSISVCLFVCVCEWPCACLWVWGRWMCATAVGKSIMTHDEQILRHCSQTTLPTLDTNSPPLVLTVLQRSYFQPLLGSTKSLTRPGWLIITLNQWTYYCTCN